MFWNHLRTGKGKTVALKDGANEVGRALTCQVSLDGDGISKVHAIVTVDENGVFVEDMGSTNKSMLGSLEEPVELQPGHKYPMEHGDVVVFGDVACVFLWLPPANTTQNGGSRSISTAPPGHHTKTGGSHLQSPTRPQTTAFGNSDLSQEEVLGQLDVLMQGMSQLYSIVQGAPHSPSNSSFATRPSTHASSHLTRNHTANDSSIGMADQSSVSFALDRSEFPQYSPWRHGQANLSLTVAPAAGTRGFDRAGVNLQGMGPGSSLGEPPCTSDAPTHGLHRYAPQAPQGPDLAPSDFMHLYAGVSRGGTAVRSRTATQQRPITSISTSPALSHDVVCFGRFSVPEHVLVNILMLTPRIPSLLRLSCVSPYLRRLCAHDSLWEELDVSWDTFAPDPICNIMTDEILKRMLATCYRTLLRKVVLHGCSFVNDWTLHALSRHSFNVETLHLDRHADIGPDVTDAGLVVLLRCLPKLQELSVGWCARIGNASCATLADHCPHLRSLNLAGCCGLGDLSIMKIADAQLGPKLERLSLRSCELVTSDSVLSLANRCTSLTELDLGGCERVRGQALVEILNSCTNLTHLDVTQCHQVCGCLSAGPACIIPGSTA